jgi:hypothetical protein
MTTTVWRIHWRDRETGNIIETAGYDYPSWDEANTALSTLHTFRYRATPTIDSYTVEVGI